jgi:hypothetical protein
VFLAFVPSCQKNAASISLHVSILFALLAPLRALRETKKLSVFAPLCLRVKKMLQAFHLRVSIPFPFLAPLRESNTFFTTFAVKNL